MLVNVAQMVISLSVPISEILFSFINLMIMFFFFSFTLGRSKGRRTYIISIVMLSGLQAGFALYNSFSSPNMVLLIASAFVFGLLLFKGSLGKRIFYITIFSVCILFAELTVFYFAQFIFDIPTNINLVLYPDSLERIVYKCLTKVITVFILYFIAKRSSEKVYIPLKYFMFIFGIYAFSVIALLFLFELCLHTDKQFNRITLLSVFITSISIMLADIFVFIVFELLSKYFSDKETARLLFNQKTMTEKYILENEKNYKEIRKLWHDLGNHLSIIQAYLNENNNPKAKSYINEVQTGFQNIPVVIKTGNEIADIVINQKRATALDNHIAFDVTAHVGEQLNISQSDLCVLLSNSLDNAIEASQHLEQEQRKITLNIRTHKQFLLLDIQNNALEPISLSGRLKTRKKDSSNHGLGILSMESIVKKYSGDINYEYSNGVFSLTIMINISGEY